MVGWHFDKNHTISGQDIKLSNQNVDQFIGPEIESSGIQMPGSS
jgi:hypothetical protein